VVDAQGVVGQVVQVSEMTSRVLLLSDVSHGLPVRITRNDVRLVANGTGELDEIELRHVAKSTDIRVGDLLVTSGLGNRFPEGYPVARVLEVLTEDGQSYARVTAQPLAALDRIRYVLLIWPSPDSGVTLPNQPTVPAADHSLIENSSKIGSASPAEGTSADTTKPVTTPAATVAKPATETTPPATEVHQ
jgi:rod shape-determining protein MreC